MTHRTSIIHNILNLAPNSRKKCATMVLIIYLCPCMRCGNYSGCFLPSVRCYFILEKLKTTKYLEVDTLSFIDKIKAYFPEISETTITPDTIFWQIDGWSSLAAIGLTYMIEQEYKVRINSLELKSVDSIDELFHLILRKMEVINK